MIIRDFHTYYCGLLRCWTGGEEVAAAETAGSKAAGDAVAATAAEQAAAPIAEAAITPVAAAETAPALASSIPGVTGTSLDLSIPLSQAGAASAAAEAAGTAAPGVAGTALDISTPLAAAGTQAAGLGLPAATGPLASIPLGPEAATGAIDAASGGAGGAATGAAGATSTDAVAAGQGASDFGTMTAAETAAGATPEQLAGVAPIVDATISPVQASLPGGISDAATGAAAGQGAQDAAEEAKKKAAQKTIGQKLLDQITNNPLTAGALGLNLASSLAQRNSANKLPTELKAAAGPASDVATSLIDQYKSGTINPSTEFDINKWEQQSIAQAKNYYAKAGIPDSTSAMHAVQQIRAQAAALRDQARQGLLTTGLNAAGIASGPLTAAAQASAQADQQFASAQGSALNSLMLLQAMQSKTPEKTASTG